MIEVNTVNSKNCEDMGSRKDSESHEDIENILNSIKCEIDIDETQIQVLNHYDVDISTVKHELDLEADNFHENESLEEEKEKDDKEEKGEEAKQEDDDNDVSDKIKDEIEIDEKPFQFPMEDIPHNIAVGSVEHIQNEDENAGDANINCKAEDVKNEIDINEGIRIKEELSFVKKEFSNEDTVDPLLPKIEPVEPCCIGNSQMDSDEFKRFGHVAVVSLCRLEDLASDVGQSLEAQSSNQHDEPLVEGESSNSSGEGRLQLRSLRKYRINRSERRGGNADTTQKSKGQGPKHRNIKAYHCSRCKFTCLTKTRLEDHLQSHGMKNHACSVCEYMTQDSSLFAIHSKIHELGKPPYKCDVCDYKTINKTKFTIHCRRHTGEKTFTCDICNSKFVRKWNLDVHIAKHTGIKPYKCEKCDYKATTRHDLKLHFERIHFGKQIQRKKSLSCDECSFKCSKPCKLNEHIRIHSGEKPYKCKMCQYTATSKADLKLHIRTHTKEKPYCCDQCDFRAASSCSLSNHKKTHCPTGEKRSTCDHKKTLTPTGGKPFICDMCGFQCNYLGNLKTHIRTHTGEKPFKCDICGFQCIYLGNLKTHIRTHTAEKPFKCDFCNYKSNQSSYLKTHVRIYHTGEKPFKCEICDYQSSASASLKNHVRTHHTGEKPFKCDYCNYKSSKSSSLKVHIRTHTGEKLFKCDICDYQGARSSHLQIHKSKFHKTL